MKFSRGFVCVLFRARFDWKAIKWKMGTTVFRVPLQISLQVLEPEWLAEYQMWIFSRGREKDRAPEVTWGIQN